MVQKEAYDLLQKDLAKVEFEHVEVTVKEAVYDGRYLRIAHATRDKSATKPFDKKTEEDVWNGNFEFRAATMDEVSWASMDYAFVNGHNLNPWGAPGWSPALATGRPSPGSSMTCQKLKQGTSWKWSCPSGQAQH